MICFMNTFFILLNSYFGGNVELYQIIYKKFLILKWRCMKALSDERKINANSNIKIIAEISGSFKCGRSHIANLSH